MTPTLVSIRHEWASALDAAEFNPAALIAIRERYAAALAYAAEREAVYAEQRAIVAAEREAAYESAWEAHAQMTKGELAAAAGYSWTPQRTKRELLDEIAHAAARRVESEHARVDRILAARRTA